MLIILLLAMSLCGCTNTSGSWTQNDSEYRYYPVATVAGRTIGLSPRKLAEASAASEERRQGQLKENRRETNELQRDLKISEQTHLLRESQIQAPIRRSY